MDSYRCDWSAHLCRQKKGMSLIHLWLLLSTELSAVLSIPGLAFTKCVSALKNEVTFFAFLEKKEKLNTCFCNDRVWICCLHDIKGNILFNWRIPYLIVLFVIMLLRYLIVFLWTTLVWNLLIVNGSHYFIIEIYTLKVLMLHS